MVERRRYREIDDLLSRHPGVVLLGPRQVGKTTVAFAIAEQRGGLYLDMESPSDRARLEEPELYFSHYAEQFIVLDEVQQVPGLFSVLRGEIDRRRRAGNRTGQFLLLGSVSRDLLRQSSESLAGRVVYTELQPFDLLEVRRDQLEKLWVRGGFPESFLADSEQTSMEWRQSFVRTYLQRDIPQLGSQIPAETMRRFWTMLAHRQGSILNHAEVARSLGVSAPTVSRWLDLLVDLMLVRRLEPWSGNLGKRLVRSPKIYVRDSGIHHTLLQINDLNALLGHPTVGQSWESFVIENILAAAPLNTVASFYRSSGGAEVDMVIEGHDQQQIWAIEIKRTLSPKPSRGLISASEDIKATRRLLLYPGEERFPLRHDVEAIPLHLLMQELLELSP
ncbi:MAG: ATP-binding protein [Ignavibacteriae bacterium]|nr:ATP-binding protein [Ignavibacteriota bacterium]MCB9217755.1 ATP-binding protein [Ignavibacteria bacterium]